MKEPLRSARYFITETDPMRIVPSIAEVAFVGRSNSGKSSLICAVCQNNKLARVSKTPGRTRGINVFETVKGRWLVDLPGYGYAAEVGERQRDYWPKMIGLTLSGRPNMKRVYVLLDIERELTPIDRSMLSWLSENQIPFSLVGTKVDRLSQSRQQQARARMAEATGILAEDIFWVSSKLGFGLKELRRDVIEALGL